MKHLPTITLAGGRKIGDGEPCFVTAEIGQNHQGDVYQALRMMTAAAAAGVYAVKLCKRHVRSDLTAAAYDAPYAGPHSFGETYGQHREALELSIDDYAHLAERIHYNGWPLILFATVCDLVSLEEVEGRLDPPLYKLASRDIDNGPLIEAVAQTGKPVVLSTGMARRQEIFAALHLIRRHHERIVLLHCTSEYPTPDNHVQLQQVQELRKRYDVLTGLSDHTPCIVSAVGAAARGAVMIEKHVTLSRAMPGTDHAASLEPEGLRRLVRYIRILELQRQADPEQNDVLLLKNVELTRQKLGRSLVTRRAIAAGERISEEMLTLKSPGTGIGWLGRGAVLGRRAAREIPADVTLRREDVTASPPHLKPETQHGLLQR